MQTTFRVDLVTRSKGTDGGLNDGRQRPFVARKAHTKSRGGCVACKKRRIKVGDCSSSSIDWELSSFSLALLDLNLFSGEYFIHRRLQSANRNSAMNLDRLVQDARAWRSIANIPVLYPHLADKLH